MMRGLRPALFLARAEVLHVVRDHATMAQIIMVPIVQLLVLANAATFEIRNTPTYVVDLDHTSTSRGLINRFAASGHFRVAGQTPASELANEALLAGRVTMVLTIPNEFEADLVRTGSAPVQLMVNAEKGSAAGIVQFYASSILADYAAEIGRDLRPSNTTVRTISEAGPVRGTPRIEVRKQSWFNPTLDYRHYMVPGILVALVTIVGTLITAQNIAREKELGTLEQLNVTPITRAQFITAKLLPFLVLALLDLCLGLTVGWLVFGIPLRGSLLLLFGVAALYLMVALSIGLWISTLVDTQQQAMFVTFFIMMIYLLMSGLFTPIDSMPRWVQAFTQLNPVRHFVTISRSRGRSWSRAPDSERSSSRSAFSPCPRSSSSRWRSGSTRNGRHKRRPSRNRRSTAPPPSLLVAELTRSGGRRWDRGPRPALPARLRSRSRQRRRTGRRSRSTTPRLRWTSRTSHAGPRRARYPNRPRASRRACRARQPR
jgi:ABC-2 type transport system permease protein